MEHTLFALPARLGGLGIGIPSRKADRELQSSLLVTAPLKDHILSQDRMGRQLDYRATIRKQNEQRNKEAADDLYSILPSRMQRPVDLAKEAGVSTWLTDSPYTKVPSTMP